MSFPTWSDLNSESIVPPLGARKAPDLGPVALMVSCKPDINLIKSKHRGARVFPFFNNTLMTLDGDQQISVAGPFMGAPYGAMILESLIARGAEKIVVLGWCGGTSPELNVGDLVVVRKAIVDEGTSRNYAHLSSDLPCSEPDLVFTQQLYDFCRDEFDIYQKPAAGQENLENETFSFRPRLSRQTIWTTDAIYRETPEKVAHFKSLGAAAVEMECSALFSVARFRKVDISALLVVSDSVAASDWKPGFRKKRFKQSREMACRMVTDFSKKELCKNG